MKKIKNLKKTLGVLAILLLFFAGCQKERSTNTDVESEKLSRQSKISSAAELKEGTIGNYAIKFKSDTISRVSKLPAASIEKIKSILSPKKKTAKATVSISGTFTATLTGGSTTDYYCEAEVDFPGPIDWYLIEESTSTYTYLATTSSESVFFFISNPTPGYYRVWGQNATMGIDTNPVFLGIRIQELRSITVSSNLQVSKHTKI